MNEISYIVLAFVGGLLIGAFFFGGLWFTVKKAFASKIPALWIFTSFFFRIGVASMGFYFIGSGTWQRLLACLLGFIIARFIVIYLTKSIDERNAPLKKEDNHEA